MPFVPGPGIAEVEIRAVLSGIPVENTLYFQQSSAVTQSNLDALTTNVNALWKALAIPLLHNTYTLNEVYAADLSAPDGLQSSNTVALPTTGTRTQPREPANVTLAISFRTGLRGRSRRGRNYWPCFLKEDITNNAVVGSHATDIIDVYTAFIGAGAVSTGWTWGVASRYTAGAPRAAILFTPITNVLVTDLTVDSQRGRLHE